MTASVQSPLKDGGGITTQRSMCVVSRSRQAGEGLRALDRCIQAGGRRGGRQQHGQNPIGRGLKDHTYLCSSIHMMNLWQVTNIARWSGGGGVTEK